MPTMTEYETVKQQCNAFEEAGYKVIFRMKTAIHGAAPVVKIQSYAKEWNFHEPDWNIVARQLSTLYMNLKGRKKC